MAQPGITNEAKKPYFFGTPTLGSPLIASWMARELEQQQNERNTHGSVTRSHMKHQSSPTSTLSTILFQALQHYSITALQHYSITALLHYCITASKDHLPWSSNRRKTLHQCWCTNRNNWKIDPFQHFVKDPSRQIDLRPKSQRLVWYHHSQ